MLKYFLLSLVILLHQWAEKNLFVNTWFLNRSLETRDDSPLR